MPATQAGTAAPGLVAVDGTTFPLRSSRLTARAAGGLAKSRLVQTYENPNAEPLEVLYVMPLPADGAVVGYTICLGERTIRGTIERKEVAQERYLNALETGRTAGLLEQQRSDTFMQSLGCLPPGVPVTVEIEVLHPLAALRETKDDLQWEYRFPTVVGVRYHGAEGRVPDRDRLDAPRGDAAAGGTPVRLESEILLDDGEPHALCPNSLSHDIVCSPHERATKVTLVGSSRLDRDVVVRWTAAGAAAGAKLVEGSGLAGDGGRYGLVTITPPAQLDRIHERDLTVLLDASGSMSGTPIAQAKRVIEGLLAGLSPRDRFEILAFANDVSSLTGGLVRADARAVRAALTELRDVAASGGTEMKKAILASLEPGRGEGQRQIIVVTDGCVGFEQEIVREIVRALPVGSRIHTVGVGSSPNRTLTRGAARAGRGTELIVGLRDDAAQAGERLRRATEAPVLTELSIAGTAVIAQAPERVRDCLAVAPAVVAVELRPEGGVLEIEGRLAGSGETWRQRIEVPAASQAFRTAADFSVGAFFGRERVEDAEARLAAAARGGNDEKRLLAEIEAAGLRHRIVTRRTSLVAVSEEPTVDPADPRRRRILEVELPDGVSAEGVGMSGIPLSVLALRLKGEGLRGQDSAFITGDTIFGLDSVAESLDFDAREAQARINGIGIDRRLLYRRIGKARAARPPIQGRVVRTDASAGILVVEFEVPAYGLELPGDGGEVQTLWSNSSVSLAKIEASGSTRSGHHEPGLTVRLVLRFESMPVGAAPTQLDWQDSEGRTTSVQLQP